MEICNHSRRNSASDAPVHISDILGCPLVYGCQHINDPAGFLAGEILAGADGPADQLGTEVQPLIPVV
jgi:hypothetical protein